MSEYVFRVKANPFLWRSSALFVTISVFMVYNFNYSVDLLPKDYVENKYFPKFQNLAMGGPFVLLTFSRLIAIRKSWKLILRKVNFLLQ